MIILKKIEQNNAICQHLKYKVQSNKWIDVENEIKEIYKGDMSFEVDFCMQRRKEFIELTEAINKYMNQIDNSPSSLNTSSFYFTKALGTYNIFNDTYVICFN